jgi:hypothetical protein
VQLHELREYVACAELDSRRRVRRWPALLIVKDDDQDRKISKQIVVALNWAGELSRKAKG